ncbi:hypothetical protein GCM10007962_23070 [Yeosuana aromativorans]|uniref:Uncharacterized protein n=1 Tax=Yeosuana aromativorans TaxID=288019 RepID=A0A8J3FI34_9FLAO|nr:hypothetical protein [Yeosuana aromativorans]GGK28186.1 hypothetical protein GCM10007962_23070 [Yeosuana aromativorans]
MKHLVFCLTFLVLSYGQSQESAIDKIAQKTCEYMNSDEMTNLDKSQKTAKLGVFIIGQYGEYKEELAKEGIEIDFSEENSSRKFGEKVGFAMVDVCPNTLIALAETDNLNGNEAYLSFAGNLVSVTGEDFSFVQVKNSEGIVQNFLWLSNFKGSERLISDNSVIGTEVKIKYKNTECFSPKLKEYINRKEIVEIEYLD